MAPRRPILLNAFDMNAVGHISHGLWRHPRDRSTEYKRLPYWLDLARTLERGLFDGLFLADVTGVYDVWGGNADAALRDAIQLPINDPAVLVGAMASVTRNLGFGITATISAEQPHAFARRMSTLDHLSEGRIGWNIVTGFLDSSARARGDTATAGHDQRYDRADEFMELVYRLWESSWDDDAVLADRASGIYTDPAKVRAIHHEGAFYKLDAVHPCEPSPQRTPLLFQAGASARGTAFAARHAEVVFVPNQGLKATAAVVHKLKAAMAEAGRDASSVRFVTTLQVVPGRTESEARERYEDYRRYARPEAGLVQFSSAIGADLSRHGLDDPVTGGSADAIQSSVASLQRHSAAPTVRQLLAQMPLGGRHTPVVGTPAQIADEIEAWVQEAGVDGFNLVRTVSPEGLEHFVDLVVPELQRRGLHKRAYAEGSWREKIFGRASVRPSAVQSVKPHPTPP
ncbi:LLM class flavin-dependent oxidoreductase [Variovorax sp. J22G73]|uniref:LLM class flavin-dependent oxidoreductase n=1 Tax=unclassified Variovorax TaxID=663243 RepID=UPI002578433C|nr:MULTISPECIES: LLM class flavin-dependent oxidoreductase [unclassified Variovorax]MDM0008124.1 LLM class flavin-dependent oxidoreductase [Variovorax sp. J22R203]MDM0100630.1 LLM class flavin-dependent oxidoreductase [Variovorax sp. J22G73]